MIISIFPNMSNSPVKEILSNTVSVLMKKNASLCLPAEIKDTYYSDKILYDSDEKIMQQCDLAIAIGGDGTTLNVAKKASFQNKPVLGINAGRLGFMSGIERNELELLENLISGNYKIDERMMLKARVFENDGEKSVHHCLNDIVISRGNFARLIDISLVCDGRTVSDMRADGVILSTPTGSTAYSMAAGGPVVSPQADCIIETPICPHTLMDRSIIFPTDKELIVRASNDMRNMPIMTVDGQEAVNLSVESEVRVSVSELTTKLIKIKPENFYEVLRRKIIERRV